MEKSQQNAPDAALTDFGFRQVPTGQKQALVRDVFDTVAARYDLMNDLMSGGLHRVWKRRLVEVLFLRRNPTREYMQMADIAGGTGDIAFRAMRAAARFSTPLNVRVIDANTEMLRVGAKRAVSEKNARHVSFITGNAEHLPLADNSLDTYTIAFGIRNVTHRTDALAEAWRVLKPGGRFVCLEFSHMPSALLTRAYDAYSFRVIPPLGGLVTGDAGPYQYLVESIRQFPRAEAFADEVRAAGFSRVAIERLSGGVAALHSGWKV